MDDQNGAATEGHMAVAIGDDTTGWDYYSKDGPSSLTDGNQYDHYSTMEDMLDAQPRYTELQYIPTSSQQDNQMLLYANNNYTTSYNICTNNCADLVVGTLQAGGITIPKNTTTLGVTLPNKVFNGLRQQQQ